MVVLHAARAPAAARTRAIPQPHSPNLARAVKVLGSDKTGKVAPLPADLAHGATQGCWVVGGGASGPGDAAPRRPAPALTWHTSTPPPSLTLIFFLSLPAPVGGVGTSGGAQPPPPTLERAAGVAAAPTSSSSSLLLLSSSSELLSSLLLLLGGASSASSRAGSANFAMRAGQPAQRPTTVPAA